MHAYRFGKNGCAVFISRYVETCLHYTVYYATAAGGFVFRRSFRQHHDACRMLHDVANPSIHFGRLRPECLTISTAICHQAVIEADINAISFINRWIELNVMGETGETSFRQRRRPAHVAGARVESAQASESVDHDHLWPGL